MRKQKTWDAGSVPGDRSGSFRTREVSGMVLSLRLRPERVSGVLIAKGRRNRISCWGGGGGGGKFLLLLPPGSSRPPTHYTKPTHIKVGLFIHPRQDDTYSYPLGTLLVAEHGVW